MAFVPRTWQTIQAQIIAQVNSLIAALTSTSNAAYWRVWTFITAISQNLMEQRFQVLQQEIEATAAAAPPETVSWVQDRVLKFQYGNVIQINEDFSVSYPDPQLPKIIVNCAVVGTAGGITIKATTNSGALSSPQQNSLLGYLETILGADVNFNVISQSADLLNIGGTIYYDGQYSGSIVANVTNAINTYIESLGFNGLLKLDKLIDAITKATGVTRYDPDNINCTPYSGSPATNLISTGVISNYTYQTVSGQIVIGTSTITFSVQT